MMEAILLADYEYKQWEQSQDNSNLINNANCLRWQAGIELAGGSWSGSFEDGKDSITIDEFNALESQINAKVSSYTPRGYDPDSTSQIVPGVDGWNRVEDGILKAICTPTGVNRNYLQVTREMPNQVTGKINYSSSRFVRSEDEDGFGVFTIDWNGSATYGINLTTISADDDKWAGKDLVFSVDLLSDVLTSNLSNLVIRIALYTSGNTQGYYQTRSFDASNVELNTDDLKDGEWCRAKVKFTMPSRDEMTAATTSTSYKYAFGIHVRQISTEDTLSFRKLKLELASEGTDWVDAPEDYGYSDNTTSLSANPQSVEDGSDTEVAPGPVEIE